MNRSFFRLAVLLVLVLSLCACAAPAVVAPTPTPSPTPAPTPTALPTPSPEPEADPLLIQYDPFLLSPRELELFDDDMAAFYRDMVQAVLDYEPRVTIPEALRNRADERYVSNVFQKYCLLEHVSGTPFHSLDGSAIEFSYRYDKAEHQRLVSLIGPQVEAIIAGNICEGYNQLEATLSLYRHLAAATFYTHDGESETAYGVIMENGGVCTGFTYALQILLTQAGYDDGYAIEWSPGPDASDDAEGHIWNALELGGDWYYVDATWENGETFGSGLKYFGITDEQRAVDMPPPYTRGYMENPGELELPVCSSDRLSPLQHTQYWYLDAARHIVYLEIDYDQWAMLNTETLEIEMCDPPEGIDHQ